MSRRPPSSSRSFSYQKRKPSFGGPSRSYERPRDFRESRESRENHDEEMEEPQTPARQETVIAAFEKIWTGLFEEPVHLDSALSKQSKRLKSTLARILPTILLRPSSQAEALGIGIGPGEPWSLAAPQLARWRTARLIAERIYGNMTAGATAAAGTREDFPARMIQEWESAFGAQTTDELVEVLAHEPPLGLRVSRRFDPSEVLQGLKQEAALPVRATLSQMSPLGLHLEGYAAVLNTEWYEKGAFEIQDEGSQVMALFALWPEKFAELLQQKPGRVRVESWAQAIAGKKRQLILPEAPPAWTVVDACSGAGGKALAIADALKGKGRIYAYDTSAKKLQALRRRATHAGYNNIQAVTVTEGKELETVGRFRRRADLVLVDAPCSGWGVLRRNPDIKWRQPPETLEKMPQIQARLLSSYSELVAPGGRLVFGVCTFRPSETRDIVENFLNEHPDFKAGPGGYLGPGPSDGFFMQAFQRNAQKGKA